MTKSPDAFRTISEVAAWLGVQAHVLRFWESKFSQIKPVKRAGGRRYYRPSDMRLIGGIKTLLHDDGMTIKGVQKILREQGVAHVAALSQPLEGEAVDSTAEEARGTVLPFKAKPGALAAEAQAPAPEDKPAASSGPAPEDKPAPGPAALGLPAFLNRPETPATPPASAAPAGGRDQADAPPTAPAPGMAAPDESEPPYTPGPLGHLAGLSALSAPQAARIAPLVRALRDWYDRNAKAGWG